MQKSFEKVITFSKEISVNVENNVVKLKSGETSVEKIFSTNDVMITAQDNSVKLFSKNSKKKTMSVINAISTQISNLGQGLKHDFEYKLEIVYSHFPMNVTQKEEFIEISNLAGAKKSQRAKIVGNTKVKVKGKEIIVSSPNKEHAGQTAANLETATKIKGKDKRVFQDGIYIVSKPKQVIVQGEEENERQ